ncbi:unnamed protein product, partial [Mesorhabditis spiculigera]
MADNNTEQEIDIPAAGEEVPVAGSAPKEVEYPQAIPVDHFDKEKIAEAVDLTPAPQPVPEVAPVESQSPIDARTHMSVDSENGDYVKVEEPEEEVETKEKTPEIEEEEETPTPPPSPQPREPSPVRTIPVVPIPEPKPDASPIEPKKGCPPIFKDKNTLLLAAAGGVVVALLLVALRNRR